MSQPLIQLKLSARLVWEGEKFFGPGTAELLEGVDRWGSLRASAQEMGMAYSKAWTMFRKAERILGYPLLEREVGGARGGSSRLTPRGRELLEGYRRLENAVNQTGAQMMEELFSSRAIMKARETDLGSK